MSASRIAEKIRLASENLSKLLGKLPPKLASEVGRAIAFYEIYEEDSNFFYCLLENFDVIVIEIFRNSFDYNIKRIEYRHLNKAVELKYLRGNLETAKKIFLRRIYD